MDHKEVRLVGLTIAAASFGFFGNGNPRVGQALKTTNCLGWFRAGREVRWQPVRADHKHPREKTACAPYVGRRMPFFLCRTAQEDGLVEQCASTRDEQRLTHEVVATSTSQSRTDSHQAALAQARMSGSTTVLQYLVARVASATPSSREGTQGGQKCSSMTRPPANRSPICRSPTSAVDVTSSFDFSKECFLCTAQPIVTSAVTDPV